jgi:uncharacterized protein (TIGR02453 family)
VDGFTGWPQRALEFYEGLEADNSKDYWTAHQSVYDADVRGPMEALLADLEPEFGDGRIFRPYRDVRFSADKSPYKTAIGATLAEGGYVQLSADGLAAASGYHSMAPDQVARYRTAVAEDVTGEELRRLIDRLTGQGVKVIGENPLKTAPRGFAKDHPRIELLRNRGLIAWRRWPVEPWLQTPQAAEHLADFLHLAEPLHAWLADRVGPSEAEL